MRVRIYCTYHNGERRTISLSEEAAWSGLKSDSKFREEERALWSVKAEEHELPEVSGVNRNWGNEDDPLWHVSWECPHCGQQHDTDIEPTEVPPVLWYCERGRGMCIVRW